MLEKGEIIEQGTRDELVALDGTYAKLYKLQFKDKELLDDGLKH